MKDALEDLRVMLQIKQGTGKGQNLKSDNNPVPFNLSELMEDDEEDDILME